VDNVARRAKEIALDQPEEGLVNGLHAFHTRNSREKLVAESSIPMHIVTGDRDELPGLSYSQRLAELSDKAHLHVIADCGHYVPMMQLMALNCLIDDVIREADTG
jgi:pimeloyl-ACP methyl ester carboxylesterase